VPASALNRFAINIGANDGRERDPTYSLFSQRGYRGLVVEGDEYWRPALERHLAPWNTSGGIKMHIGRAMPSTVAGTMQDNNMPRDVDALKVDIDSVDLDVVRALLKAGFRPKVISVEINADIPPPFRWEVSYSASFPDSFPHITNNGIFGASADAVWATLSNESGYSLVSVELLGARERCPHCEHNMWFVRNDLLGLADADPLVTWWGMVRLFWAQVEISGQSCLHMNRMFRCPLQDMPALALAGGGNDHDFRPLQSLFLALPEQRQLALNYARSLQNIAIAKCTEVACSHLTASKPEENATERSQLIACSKEACPISVGVTHVDGCLSPEVASLVGAEGSVHPQASNCTPDDSHRFLYKWLSTYRAAR